MSNAVIPQKTILSHSVKFIPEGIHGEEMHKILEDQALISQTPANHNIATEIPMPFHEEAIVVVFWFVFFSLMLYGPFVFLYLLVFHQKIAFAVAVVGCCFSLYPTQFQKFAGKGNRRYLVTLILKYFSHRGVWTHYLPEDRPSIVVGPPHGVFPFGSLVAAMALPRITGLQVRGIAATAIVRFPLIGNFLRVFGIIDATKHTVKSHLEEGWSIGISSGGIAEIFETKCKGHSTTPPAEMTTTTVIDPVTGERKEIMKELSTECIILHSRGGICKLALETGSYLIPSYVFGNTLCLSIWYDPFGIMQWLSRVMRVSLVFFWGRWGLPIPYRVPILGVVGDPIRVEKKLNPTKQEIQELLNLLEEKIQECFDKYKASYGWDETTLIIK